MPNFGSHLSGPVRQTTRLRGQSDRAWYADLPIGMNDPDYVHKLVDFTVTTDYNTNDYTLSSSGTGTSAAVSTSGVNGLLLLQTGTTAGNYATVQNKTVMWLLDRTLTANTHVPQSDKKMWFETSVSFDTVTDINMFVGLSETQANPFSLSNNRVGFTIASGSGKILCVSSTAGVTTTVSTSLGSGNSVTAVASTLVKLGFVFDSANNVKFYINRNFIAQVGSGSIPSAVLTNSAQIQVSSSANNRTMTLDYMYTARVR